MIAQDKILEKIRGDFQLMTKVVLNQIAINKRIITEELDSENVKEFLEEIDNNEGVIDSIEVKLRSEVINTIVLFSPRATDLRKIIAYYDMTAYLERIGDLLVNVSEYVTTIDKQGIVWRELKEKAENLFFIVENMTQNAIFAFVCEDNILARKTILDDDKADTANDEINFGLHNSFVGRELSAQQINDILSLSGLARNLERIGDNATNIAESAIYLTEGRDIKHFKDL